MKRMKKKVVAMVTLAMFVMSMLPMAAFAAYPSTEQADVQTSTYKTAVENPTVAEGEEVLTVFELKDANEELTSDDFATISIWATDDQGRVSTATEVYDVDGDNLATGNNLATNGIYTAKNVTNDTKFALKFKRDGEYTIHAVNLDKVPENEAEKKHVLKKDAAYSVIKVENKVVEIGSVDGTDANFTNEQANGVEKVPVKVTVTPKVQTETVPVGTVVTLTNTNEWRGLDVVDKDGNAITEVAVSENDGKNGIATFYVMADNSLIDGEYRIGLACGDVTGDVTVTVPGASDDNNAVSIEALPVDGAIVAKDFEQVQFAMKNAAGELITAPVKEPVVAGDIDTTYKHDSYVKIVKQPEQKVESKKLTPADVYLKPVAGTDYMGLDIRNKKTLVDGEYTIAVALKNGQWAETSFTVATFGKVVDIKIVPANDGEIVLDGDATSFTIYKVDENGLMQKYADQKNCDLGITPVAEAVDVKINGDNSTITAKLKDGADRNEVLGTKVTVTAVAKNYNAVDSYEFTIVDSTANTDYELVYDETEGVVLKNNPVKVTIENKDADKIGQNKEIERLYVKLLEQSNEDAKVAVNAKADNKTIQIYSDKDTTVDVQVIAITKDNLTYAGTLTYAIGEKVADTEETTVVMTLGSTEMIINNKVVDMKDAAPFAQDNRTFVPFRALGEKVLGATVEYDKDAKTVTYELDANKIVMTLDSKTYTVNGKEKTMDVAPFAKDNRTYVPVRFVGEALGFTVTGLTNGAGQYVGVAFTK